MRSLRRHPGFSALIIIALALGIGATSAIFTVVDAVLVRPLPYPDAERLVVVWEDNSRIGFPKNTPAVANWVDWRKQNTVFTDIAATRGRSVTLTGGSTPEYLLGRGVTANLWTILGVQPALGRVFSSDEDERGERVAVLSYSLWQRRFGGDPAAVGRDVWLSDQKFRVVAVMPQGFFYPNRQVEIWLPASFTPAELARRGSHNLQTLARLKPGVSVAQAQAEMAGLMRRLEAAYPKTNLDVGARVEPLRDAMVGFAGAALWVLLVAAGCVLLIACANIANLLLAQALGRKRETAVRSALGASRTRILVDSLKESLALAACGALAGLVAARLSLSLLVKLIPDSLPTPHLALDARVLGFTTAVALLTALLFGAAPAQAMARCDLQEALKQGGRSGAGARSHRFRDTLVVVEVALSLLLLVGAGLMLRTLQHLQSLDLGFQSGHLLTLSTTLPRPRYDDPLRREQFFLRVLDDVHALPGVVATAYTSNLPFTSIGNTNYFLIEGRSPTREQDALLRTVSQDFFQTLGARLIDGRLFGSEDRAESAPVIVINETFARAYWPGESPVGKRVQCPTGDDQPYRTVVGVVRDVRERGLEPMLKPAVYVPLPQARNVWAIAQDLVVRTSVEPTALAAAVRSVIAKIDPDQPVRAVRTMEELADTKTAGRRQQMSILGAFAGLALLLASVGIYGVLAYAVTLRTREIGIRLALGSSRAAVLGGILRHGFGLTMAGIIVGGLSALALTRALASLLNGVAPNDPTTFGISSAVLLAVAALACYLPALRASSIDPAITLRDE